MMKIGIQGLAASYSDAALALYAPNAIRSLYDKFSDVFHDLVSAQIDKGFLPFENSTAGFIAENFRLLESSGCYVTGEYIHKVEHCLLAQPGAVLSEIKAAMSHPQALAQCSHFLHDHNIAAEPWFDTAGAARDLLLMRNKTKAAIASAEAARVYGLEILKRGINDEAENHTRFMLIEREAVWGQRLLVACSVEELRNILLSDVKLITMLTHADERVRWGHRVYLELDKTNNDQTFWQNWLKKFPSVKMLGSLDGKR